MRKIISLLLVFMLIFMLVGNTFTYATNYVKMFAPDGRTLLVIENEVNTYKNVGWYTEPVQKLYALDGRSVVFKKTEVAAQLTVGWYEHPVVMMYALDGRTLVINTNEIAAYENVGWYYGKPAKLYASDGRYCWVGENKYNDTVIMYALDGRIQAVNKDQIVANEKVGWFYGLPTKMYAPDGRIITIGANRVEEYKKVGWYTDQKTALKYAPKQYPSYQYSIVPLYEAVTGKTCNGTERNIPNTAWIYKYKYDDNEKQMIDDVSKYSYELTVQGFEVVELINPGILWTISIFKKGTQEVQVRKWHTKNQINVMVYDNE